MIVVENHSSGIQIVQELGKDDILIRGHKPNGDKESRLILQSSKVENGTILFPEQAPWLADYENELLRFPHAKHDDQVDATTMILEVCNMNIIKRLKKSGNKNPESEGSVNLRVFSARRGYSEYDRVMGASGGSRDVWSWD